MCEKQIYILYTKALGPGISKGAGNWVISYVISAKVDWIPEESLAECTQSLLTVCALDPAVPLIGIYPEEITMKCSRHTYMFI